MTAAGEAAVAARVCDYCTEPAGMLIIVRVRPGDRKSARVALGNGHERCRERHSDVLKGLRDEPPVFAGAGQ